MSVSTEVQRTLVKSPPELWSELSDPAALMRHLGELGDIRITAVEPETQVEWETDGASGVVQLEQSGWGTRVTLSLTRTSPAVEGPPSESVAIAEPPAVEPPAVEPPAVEPPAVEPLAVEPLAVEPPTAEPPTVEPPTAAPLAVEPPTVEPSTAEPPAASEPVASEPESELGAAIEPQLGPTPENPEPQLGFFARLFRKRKAKPAAVVEPESESNTTAKPGVEPEPKIEVLALAAPDPIYPQRPAEVEPDVVEPAEDLAAELVSMEAQMTAETTALLTSVLDRLGAAHHRPFSRG